MMFYGLLHEAWISIGASRMRTMLAMLGIVIGVGSVVLMLAIGSGSRKAVEESINKLGSNLLIITPGGTSDRGVRTNTVSRLTEQDANAIAQIPSVAATAAVTIPREFQVASGKLNWSTRVTGVTADYFFIRNWTFIEGEGFAPNDMRLGKRVAIIGTTIVKNLFPEKDALGATLRINSLPFKVIGILEPKGQDFNGRDQDDAVFIPLNTAQNKLWGNNYYLGVVQTIFVQVVPESLNQATQDITDLIRQRHKLRESNNDDFNIRNLTSITQAATETTKALSLLLGAIASISLIVGGIGIMNIMLVTVTERTREIGIRKAIGATEHQILLQFLMEAVIITTVGSIIGLLLGYAGGLGANYWFAIAVDYNLWSVLLALAVAVGVGIASGIYPARKASTMQPIEALRTVGA
jgi:putative ABC transport system permease protein